MKSPSESHPVFGSPAGRPRPDTINAGPFAPGFPPGTLKVGRPDVRKADDTYTVTWTLAHRPWGWPIDCPPAAGPVIRESTASR